MTEANKIEHQDKNKFNLLKNSRVFGGLSEDTIYKLLKSSHIDRVSKDEILFMQSDAAKYFYIVLDGSVKIFIEAQNGNEVLLKISMSGDLIGKSALIQDATYMANAQILQDATLLKIKVADIQELLDSDPKLLGNLLNSTLVSSYDFAVQISRTLTLSAPQRLGCFLMKYSGEKINEVGLKIELPFEKRIIASYLQMTPETMSRAIATLKNHGLKFVKSHVVIEDTATLKKYCCCNCIKISSPNEYACI